MLFFRKPPISQIDSFAVSNIGKQRQNNEDNFAINGKYMDESVVAQCVDGKNVCVSGGTLSTAQQRSEMLSKLREQMKGMPAKQALDRVLALSDWPGTGERLMEYCVEMQIQDEQKKELILEALQQTAWRFGFIQTKAQTPDTLRLRYVGKPHATAMTYLNLELEKYLKWLHQKKVLTVMENGLPKYVILCEQMTGERVQFALPEGAEYDVSNDNAGYAIAACTLP